MPASKTQNADGHHYFANHAMGWATGATEEEAIEALLLSHLTDPSWVRNCLKQGEPLVIFTCRVHEEAGAPYRVEWFQPVGVETSEGKNQLVVYLTKTKFAVVQDFTQEVKQLKARVAKLTADLDQVSSEYLNAVNAGE